MTTAKALRAILSTSQQFAILAGIKSEEGTWFKAKVTELLTLFESMPKIYQQDGLGKQAIVHIHYFMGACDWYITERDTSIEQHQAFGYADLGHGHGEMGYISIAEIIKAGAELDLHWTPKTLAECLAG